MSEKKRIEEENLKKVNGGTDYSNITVDKSAYDDEMNYLYDPDSTSYSTYEAESNSNYNYSSNNEYIHIFDDKK